MPKATHVFIGLGSNLFDRLDNLRRSIDLITDIPATEVIRQSPIYETEPVNHNGQEFLNCVLELRTELEPHDLLRHLMHVEQLLGRSEPRSDPRTIDLDILLIDDEVIDDEQLRIPHPRMRDRRFVLQPLCDLAPDVKIDGQTVQEWLERLGDGQRLVRV